MRENIGEVPFAESVEAPEIIGLAADDLSWLSTLANRRVGEDELAAVNRDFEVGSLHLNEDIDPELFSTVMRSRESFFHGILGWDKPEHQLHSAYMKFINNRVCIAPLDTVVPTLRYIYSIGLDVTKVVEKQPPMLGLNADSVRDKVDNLTALGLDATKIINAFPAVLGYNADSVRDKVDNLTALSLDATKIINTSPPVIGFNPKSVRNKVNNLTFLGLNSSKVINTFPSILVLNPKSVRNKVNNLTALGLDATKIINAFPAALGYNSDSIRAKFDSLTAIGIDAAKFINTTPAALGFNREAVRIKHALLSYLIGRPVETVEFARSVIKPAESLLLYAHYLGADFDTGDKSVGSLSAKASRLTSIRGYKTAPERKAAIEENYTDIRPTVGCLAVRLARYNKLDSTSWLEGETIEANTLMRKPEYPIVAA